MLTKTSVPERDFKMTWLKENVYWLPPTRGTRPECFVLPLDRTQRTSSTYDFHHLAAAPIGVYICSHGHLTLSECYTTHHLRYLVGTAGGRRYHRLQHPDQLEDSKDHRNTNHASLGDRVIHLTPIMVVRVTGTLYVTCRLQAQMLSCLQVSTLWDLYLVGCSPESEQLTAQCCSSKHSKHRFLSELRQSKDSVKDYRYNMKIPQISSAKMCDQSKPNNIMECKTRTKPSKRTLQKSQRKCVRTPVIDNPKEVIELRRHSHTRLEPNSEDLSERLHDTRKTDLSLDCVRLEETVAESPVSTTPRTRSSRGRPGWWWARTVLMVLVVWAWAGQTRAQASAAHHTSDICQDKYNRTADKSKFTLDNVFFYIIGI